MPGHSSQCTEFFEIEEKAASDLQHLNDKDLRSFATIENDSSDEGQYRASSYAYYALLGRTGLVADLLE
jgi:hypothetical protein